MSIWIILADSNLPSTNDFHRVILIAFFKNHVTKNFDASNMDKKDTDSRFVYLLPSSKRIALKLEESKMTDGLC